MGWNSGIWREISFVINWKDEVGDQRVEEFAQEVRKQAEEFIARKIQERFGQQITNGRVSFMCGDFDSYSKV